MNIQLTELAAQKILKQIQRRGRGLGIRIGVKTTGCSGLAYVLEFVDAANDSDQSFTHYGATVFVDPKSAPYLNGLVVDYERNGLNEGFAFRNPMEKDRCGCGESFRV